MSACVISPYIASRQLCVGLRDNHKRLLFYYKILCVLDTTGSSARDSAANTLSIRDNTAW
ncbi:MAG: hypothetical protein JXJ04_26295 [Spirochaetales bacterium]|nr:hypothetical protein [Spirochaetales bacterium]